MCRIGELVVPATVTFRQQTNIFGDNGWKAVVFSISENRVRLCLLTRVFTLCVEHQMCGHIVCPTSTSNGIAMRQSTRKVSLLCTFNSTKEKFVAISASSCHFLLGVTDVQQIKVGNTIGILCMSNEMTLTTISKSN